MSEEYLRQLTLFYDENLKDKKFKLTAGRKGITIELNLRFGAEHFKHLVGLHKLIDLPLSRRNSAIILKEILDEKIVNADIQKSRFFSQIEDRIKNFTKIKEVLYSRSLILKSLKGMFLGVFADYLLYSENNEERLHLFFKDDKGILVPVTFFARNDDSYIKNNTPWKVLLVEEIIKPSIKEVITDNGNPDFKVRG